MPALYLVGTEFDAMAIEQRGKAADRRQHDALEDIRAPGDSGKASIWYDPVAAARRLVNRSMFSTIEPLLSAARAQREARRAAAWTSEQEWERDTDGRFCDAGGGSSANDKTVAPGDVETAGEHSGADGAVSDAFKAKVQIALQALDPQVAA